MSPLRACRPRLAARSSTILSSRLPRPRLADSNSPLTSFYLLRIWRLISWRRSFIVNVFAILICCWKRPCVTYFEYEHASYSWPARQEFDSASTLMPGVAPGYCLSSTAVTDGNDLFSFRPPRSLFFSSAFPPTVFSRQPEDRILSGFVFCASR